MSEKNIRGSLLALSAAGVRHLAVGAYALAECGYVGATDDLCRRPSARRGLPTLPLDHSSTISSSRASSQAIPSGSASAPPNSLAGTQA